MGTKFSVSRFGFAHSRANGRVIWAAESCFGFSAFRYRSSFCSRFSITSCGPLAVVAVEQRSPIYDRRRYERKGFHLIELALAAMFPSAAGGFGVSLWVA